MKHNLERITIAGRQCFVFLPNNYKKDEASYPVAYIHGDEAVFSLLNDSDFLSELSFIIIGIFSENRLNELTPWPSPSLHPKFPDFGGGGNTYIEFIEGKLKPEVDKLSYTYFCGEYSDYWVFTRRTYFSLYCL